MFNMTNPLSHHVVGWKTIEGASSYEISTDGAVRRLVSDGKGRGIGRILNPARAVAGYPVVNLMRDDGSYRTFNIHRLLAIAFLRQTRTEAFQVAHDDDDKSNFKLSNLAWKTPAENGKDGSRNQRPPNGNRHCNTKIPDEMIPVIRAWPGRVEMLARELGVRASTLSRIRAGSERVHATGTAS